MDGIIFDIDGTLWDSTDPVAASWNRAIQENSSLDLTVDAKILSGLFGKTMTEIRNELFPALPVKEREHLLNICLEQENNYLEQHPGIFYDGVIETIKKLSEKHPLFIVSNCQRGYIEVTIKSGGIESCIKDHLCFGETQVSKGQTLLMLMERNGLKEPVYVGDTQGDANACREAGIPFIFAEYGFGNVPDAEIRIHAFSELSRMFL